MQRVLRCWERQSDGREMTEYKKTLRRPGLGEPSWGIIHRVVSSEISGGIFPEISGKITVLFRNNSAEKRTCQTPSYFITMSTF